MANWKEKAETKLEKFIDDITTLEVVTMSGDLTIKDLKLGNSKNIPFQKIFDTIKGKASTDSSIDIVAATKIDLDKDVQQFIKGNMSEEEKQLYQLHARTIDQAQQARKATFDVLLNLVRN